jgi:hypothetical protein
VEGVRQEARGLTVPIVDIQTHLDFYNMLVDDFDDFMREQHSTASLPLHS